LRNDGEPLNPIDAQPWVRTVGSEVPLLRKRDRQTDMYGPVMCSSLTLERQEHLKTCVLRNVTHSLGPRRRYEDNIKMEGREIGMEDVDWIYLVQDRDQWQSILNSVMNFLVQ
jgi:hypothetical protein